MKATHIDFSKHDLVVDKSENATIYKFRKDNSVFHSVYFINACGILSVTGDFGNWIFCREFHPRSGENNYASRSYMDEKLEIYSQQKAWKFSSEETLKSIESFKKEFKNYYGRKMNEEEKEWIENLKYNSDTQFDYEIVAYRQKPSEIDYESVPYGKKRDSWLEAIYDAFDAMCDKLNNQSTNP